MLAGPAREGIGLVVADMHDRGRGIDRSQTAKGQLLPFAVMVLPVTGSLPALVLHCGPAIRKPQHRIGVAAVLDELGPLAVGHQRTRDAHLPDQDTVRRRFIVETISFALMTDGVDAFG